MSGTASFADGRWYPPIPSLAALPVDRTKTEPKPAYYKLQFGDDVTGFSYYVRTLAVLIGRNCERGAPVPPPAITSPSIPPIPPLVDTKRTPIRTLSLQLVPPTAIVVPPALPHSLSLPELSLRPSEPISTQPDLSQQDNLYVHTGTDLGVREVPGSPNAKDPVKAEAQSFPDIREHAGMEIKEELGNTFSGFIDHDDEPGGPPPPPPAEPTGDLDHVDVDLGPLKSVSRNHARIEYRSDLGQFCLAIYGRNGAWVDERYFVRGSVVPLNQGSQIQIATRIFSFILPPSPMSSPTYTHYALDGTPNDAGNSLDNLPYPYNLPPAQVGYHEFYGEAGPGPSTMAARVPQSFSAFAATDGQGLGIEGLGNGEWVEDWASEEESDESSREDSYDEDSQDDTNSEDRSRSSVIHGESELSSLSDDPEGESEQSDTDGLKQPEKPGTGNKVKNKQESMLASVTDPDEKSKRKPARQTAKTAKDNTNAGPKKGKGEKVVEEAEVVSQEPPTRKGTARTRLKISKPEVDISTAEDAKPARPKKESKKSSKATPSTVEAGQAVAQSDAVAATLALAMGTNSPSNSSNDPASQAITASAGTNSAPGSSASHPPVPTLAPRSLPTQSSGAASAGPFPRQGPFPTTAQLQAQARSIPSPSPTGSADPHKPFYLTELIETPGRLGHIVVDVPIPPSGAGPRPPPGPLIGLDGQPFIGPSPLKPTATFASIIHRALVYLPRGRGTLGEVCNWVAGEWEWFRLNVDSGWQNSIRHNLSLNKAFLKVPRIPEDDPESKGSVWIIDPDEGPAFEEKQRRDAMKSDGKGKNVDVRRGLKPDDRAKKPQMVPPQAARAMPPQRVMAVAARPAPRPAPPPVSAPSFMSANAKGVLQPKAKIIVVIQPITAAMRSKSVISTSDVSGNLLPFVCDGTTLVLDQQTFGHLTSDITDKLTLLGAAGAVDVLSAWVINKNKQQIAKAAQTPAATPVKPVVPLQTTGTIAKPAATPRPVNGVSPQIVAKSLQRPKTVATDKQAYVSATSAATKSAVVKAQLGAAPAGASLTKVIGMIAEVANAKGDVNTVGPNALALLRYIRVVGVDIDLRVAERIWATGVVPPLPIKKPLAKTDTPVNGAKRKLDEEQGAASPVSASQVVLNGIEGEAKKPRLGTSSA